MREYDIYIGGCNDEDIIVYLGSQFVDADIIITSLQHYNYIETGDLKLVIAAEMTDRGLESGDGSCFVTDDVAESYRGYIYKTSTLLADSYLHT